MRAAIQRHTEADDVLAGDLPSVQAAYEAERILQAAGAQTAPLGEDVCRRYVVCTVDGLVRCLLIVISKGPEVTIPQVAVVVRGKCQDSVFNLLQ